MFTFSTADYHSFKTIFWFVIYKFEFPDVISFAVCWFSSHFALRSACSSFRRCMRIKVKEKSSIPESHPEFNHLIESIIIKSIPICELVELLLPLLSVNFTTFLVQGSRSRWWCGVPLTFKCADRDIFAYEVSFLVNVVFFYSSDYFKDFPLFLPWNLPDHFHSLSIYHFPKKISPVSLFCWLSF